VTEDLDLRPLVRRDRILERQLADPEGLADGARRGEVVEALHVDPEHGPAVALRRERRGLLHDRLVGVRAVAGDQPQRGRRRGRLRCHGD
jgi:hypothetical protein